VILRAATRADAARVSALCNAATRELHGEGDATESEVLTWFDLPGIETVVAEEGRELVGYMDVREEEGRVFVDVRVAPAAHGRGVADALLARAEEWAREHVPRAAMRAFAPERDHEVQAAVRRAGYELVRHSFTMQIDLPDEIAAPSFPDGVTARTYRPADERSVFDTFNESFADHWDFQPQAFDLWRTFMFRTGHDPELWWLAEVDGELAGVSINAWHFSGDPTYGWIGTLGVKPQWRRRGIACALLLQSFRDFRARGAQRVGLGVDAENTTGAVALYEGVGMRAVRRNDNFWKDL
jgi:mycothiol synthase